MVKALDKYVFLRVLKYFFLSYLVFISLFVVVEFISHLDKFLETKNFEFGLIYVFSRVPLYTVRVLPISMLISTLVTVGDFSSTSELTVVKSLGISIYRFSLPIIVFSVFVFFLSVLINEILVPSSTRISREMYAKIEGKSFSFTLEGSVWFRKGRRVFISMDRADVKRRSGEKVMIIEVDENMVPIKRIDSERAIYKGGTEWILEGVVIRNLKEKSFKKMRSLEFDLGISLNDLLFNRVDPEMESFFSLLKSINHLKSMGYNVQSFIVDLYNKISIPFIAIIAALFGIPLGSYNPRNRKGYTVLVAAGLIVFLWFAISIFSALGKSGILPPLYASFSPEVGFASLALILLSRVHT
jgi:lipopolysaccharide export system permease protein